MPNTERCILRTNNFGACPVEKCDVEVVKQGQDIKFVIPISPRACPDSLAVAAACHAAAQARASRLN